MARALSLFTLVFGCLVSLSAQNGLAGLWEGEITKGGLHTENGYRFELYLTVKDGHIKGQSYIYVSEDSIITRRLSGRMYEDRSIYLEEVSPGLVSSSNESFSGDVSASAFTRKYQILYNRSIWDTNLEGYWQEVTPHSFSEKRQRGRVKLKKKENKAKA